MVEGTVFSEELFEELHSYVRDHVDDRRYAHILSVEKKACELAQIFLPEKISELRAAAILHDVTKCLSLDEHMKICRRFGYPVGEETPHQVLHAITGALMISGELSVMYPVLSDPEIFTAVRWHATGHSGMSIFEAVIYLADYIEDSRVYDDCVAVRNYLSMGLGKNRNDNYLHLYKTLVISFGYTMEKLIDENSLIDPNTVDSWNYFLNMIRSSEKGSEQNDA